MNRESWKWRGAVNGDAGKRRAGERKSVKVVEGCNGEM